MKRLCTFNGCFYRSNKLWNKAEVFQLKRIFCKYPKFFGENLGANQTLKHTCHNLQLI